MQRLTPRQLEVLALYSRGLHGRQVAQRLYIEPGTVRRHLVDISERLGGTRSVAHSISVAVARGELVADPENGCVRLPIEGIVASA